MLSMDRSHLSVVLDLNPAQWHLAAADPSDPLTLAAFLSQLLAFLNAHIALKHENDLAVFAALPGKSLLLYPDQDTPLILSDSNVYPPFQRLDSAVVAHIADELDTDHPSDDPLALVGALTKALCYINRISLGASTAPDAQHGLTDPRILILSVSPDLSTSYIPIMNAIFSAQKLKVSIDACQIFGPDTVFLQQAAHLTGGSYLHLERRDALLQYLIMAFLPPLAIRKVLAVPTQDKIDFRAACFCHKNIVDIGFVCSVCLSIFCQPVPVCSTCRTKFPLKTLQRLNASRPPTVTPSSRPTPASNAPSHQAASEVNRNGSFGNPPVANGSRH